MYMESQKIYNSNLQLIGRRYLGVHIGTSLSIQAFATTKLLACEIRNFVILLHINKVYMLISPSL